MAQCCTNAVLFNIRTHAPSVPISSTNRIARNKYRIWIGSPISVLHHPVLIRLHCNAVNVLDDRMHNPPHPGEKLSKLWLDPLELSVTRAAEALDVSRKTLSEIVNGKAAISPEMAMRLEIAFGKSAESWLAHQAAFDLWQVSQPRDDLARKTVGGTWW